MAKRALCLLLALATVFSLAAPALAEGEAVTEEEVVTEEPVEEPEVTEGPVVTEEPVEVTEEPTVTEEPVEVTEEPVVTEEPEEVPAEPGAEPETAATFGTCGDGVTWTLTDDGTLTISGNGAINDKAFRWRDDIKTVIIENGVTSIGEDAFDRCEALTAVSIGNSVKEIGKTAFFCDGLTSLTIPDSVTTVGDQAFDGCNALVRASIGSGVKTIGLEAFGGWRGLKELAIHCNAETALYAFPNIGENSGSVAVTFGPEVTRIPSYIFSNVLGESGLDDFRTVTSVVIPDSVTCIGSYAFDSCSGLTSLNLPSSVVTIENGAFNGCSGLTELTIPDSVTNIGNWAFSDCAGLTSITIGSGVTSLGSTAFDGCLALSSLVINASIDYENQSSSYFDDCGKNSGSVKVTFGDKVTRIPAYMFERCENLTSVTIPDSVTSIGKWAFIGCSSLKSITIPSGVTSIEEFVFDGCTSLTSVTIPNGVTSIGDAAFADCTGLTSVTIPDSVTSIGQAAFASCEHLTSVTIPADVTSIEDRVFNGCAALADVTIPNGVTSIGQYAFANCTSLPSVSIPASVTEIGPCAFDGCAGLTKITILNPKCGIPWLVNDSDTNFETIPAKTTIYGYDDSTAEAYAKKNGNKFVSLGKAPVTPTSKPTATPKPQATPVPTLSAPTVTISQVSDGIKVSWNKITGSPRYMVYYKEGNGGWTKIGTTTATTYTRAAKYLKAGVTYAFTVRCCANDKTTMLSGYKASNSVKYTVDLAAPTVTIAKAADGIKVSWNKIDGAPRYMVYYKENGGSWTKIGTTTATSYTRKAAQLKSGATYQFTVRCCANDKKTMLGPYKASNSLKYTAQLAAPTVKIAKVSGGIKVSWNKITGSPRYMVYYKENSGGWKKIGTTTATSYTRAAKYLKNGVTYTFTVRCCENDKKTLLGPYKASNSLKYTK